MFFVPAIQRTSLYAPPNAATRTTILEVGGETYEGLGKRLMPDGLLFLHI